MTLLARFKEMNKCNSFSGECYGLGQGWELYSPSRVTKSEIYIISDISLQNSNPKPGTCNFRKRHIAIKNLNDTSDSLKKFPRHNKYEVGAAEWNPTSMYSQYCALSVSEFSSILLKTF